MRKYTKVRIILVFIQPRIWANFIQILYKYFKKDIIEIFCYRQVY